MDFRLLGPLEVAEGGRRLKLGGTKQRALLADLLIHANRVVAAERLIDDLWEDEPPATATNVLQTMIGQLRRVLEPHRQRGEPSAILETVAPGYRLRVQPDEMDALRFESLVAEARQRMPADPHGAAVRLRRALAFWRGPALGDVAGEPFAQHEAARLEERRLLATEERIEADLALGRHPDLVGELESLVRLHPLRERLCGQLMLALYRSGRQAEASEVFHETRKRLADELGMEPSTELQRLFRQILNQDPDLGSVRPTPAVHRERTNLPTPLTRLVGKASEVGRVRQLLSRSRLVTLTGVGGIGKTRLAVETVTGLMDEYPDGVWIVELASLGDGTVLAETLAAAVDVRPRAGMSGADAIVGALRDSQCLLVLDTCEHLVAACAETVEVLLRGCPRLHVLATSREVLGVPGETVWRVQPLSIPPPTDLAETAIGLEDFEAVQLFVERAASAVGGFELNESAALVARICRSLEGIPLAIELAAAGLRMLPVAALEARLTDHLAMAGIGGRRSVARQRTLEATLDWSYALLAAEEQALFRRLGTFAGGFELTALEQVCGGGQTAWPVAMLGLIAALIDKSLVSVEAGVEGMGRYRLLEPVRQYASRRLDAEGEREGVARRHATFYLRLAGEAEQGLRGPLGAVWVRRVEEDLDNLRDAFTWALTHDPESAVRATTALFRFWRLERQLEGRRWISQCLETPIADDELCAAILRGGCWLEMLTGRRDEARRLGERSLAIGERLESSLIRGRALHALGIVELFAGESERAIALLQAAEPHLREAGDPTWLASALNDLGNCLLHSGDPLGARARVEEAVALGRTTDDAWMLGYEVETLAQIEFAMGGVAAARSHWTEGLRRGGAFRSRFLIHYCLVGLARVALLEGEPARCLRLLGAAMEMPRRMGLTVEPPIERAMDEARRGAEARLGSDAAAEAWRAGKQLSLDEAVEYGGDAPPSSVSA